MLVEYFPAGTLRKPLGPDGQYKPEPTRGAFPNTGNKTRPLTGWHVTLLSNKDRVVAPPLGSLVGHNPRQIPQGVGGDSREPRAIVARGCGELLNKVEGVPLLLKRAHGRDWRGC